MGLYGIAVGDGHQRERGALLPTFLGNPTVARYRDAWVEKGEDGGPVIAIYTRQGGGNRECFCDDSTRHLPADCYAACNEVLAEHPLYIRDADDDFDATYATFYFRCPAEPPELHDLLAGAAGEHVNMSERWQEAIDRIGKGDLRPAETAMADQLGAMLSDPSPDSPKVMEI